MTYDEFVRRLREQADYETIYDDTEGREILVIRVISAFAFMSRLIQDEREACAKNIGDTTAAWTPIEQPYPLAGKLDILLGDGSILCGVIPQEEGDLWWSGTAEKFIDPQYYDITHWRIHCNTAAIRARGQA